MNRNIHIKALRVAYKQYFNGIEAVTDNELLSMHFKLEELISIEDDVSSWSDERLANYSVWHPFADITPPRVFSYLIASYEDVIETIGLGENVIVIDKLKAATILSHNVVVAEFKDTQTKYEFADASTGDAVYTQIAQELFDEFFPYYVSQLEEVAIV